MSSFKYIAVTVLLASALSCSVKEDRSACLCCLGIDYSECNDNGDRLVLIGWDALMSESFTDVPEQRSAYSEYFVPRCEFTLSASSGAPVVDGKYAMVKSGNQADSLYACSDRFVTDAEYCFRKLSLSKQFTTVRIITVEGSIPLGRLTVRSSSAGISLADLSPVQGDHTFTVDEISGGIFQFRLYRQGGQLEAVIPSVRSGGEDLVLDLAEILDRCGYDWNESSLRDVDLYLDRAMTCVSVSISEWNYGETIDIAI